jgi:thioredoxin reductase
VEAGGVRLRPARTIVACDPGPEGALQLRLDNGDSLATDRIILATGYATDIARLPYLTDGLLSAIETEAGSPVLDPSFQTSVPGLYMTSKLAARDFGPFMAFTVAARASARIVGHALAGRN